LAAEASQMVLLIRNPSGITNKQLGVANGCQCILGFVLRRTVLKSKNVLVLEK